MDNKKLFSGILGSTKLYLAALLVFCAVSFVKGHYLIGAGEGAVTLVLLIYYLIIRIRNKKEISGYLQNLSSHLENVSKESMMKFPFPITLLDLTGTLVWYNKEFSGMIEDGILMERITDTFNDIKILDIIANKDYYKTDVFYKGKCYNVMGYVLDEAAVGGDGEETVDYSIILYWIEKTAEVESINKYNAEKPVSCILTVDNYDDIIKNTPVEFTAELSSVIEQTVQSFISTYNGIFRKYEKDEYFAVFSNESLEKMMNEKFIVLDTAREIRIGNKIPVTLSIGIGKGENLKESDEFAKAALDMALGRGGDQAVVKNTEKVRYFGGVTEGIERNTRVKARVVAYSLKEHIEKSDIVFVVGHKNCDADSLGAAVAICNIARMLNVRCYILDDGTMDNVSKITDELKKTEEYEGIFIAEQQAISIATENSLFVAVDTHSPMYLCAPKLLETISRRVLIDHHRRGADFIEDAILTYHEPYASSTCEMVTEIIQYITDKPMLLNSEVQAIYSGIVLDTKNFTQKTGVRTFDAASYLRRKGVDTVFVKKIFQTDAAFCIKKAKVISTARLYKNKYAIAFHEDNEKMANILASQSADEMLDMNNVVASFVMCRSEGYITLSARSLGNFNVQLVAEQLGGGGHMTVAGAQLDEISMQSAYEALKKAIDSVEKQ